MSYAVPIKVGMLISYDYRYACYSLPLLYDHADRITLAIDQDCRTWAGNPFAIDDSFWDWLQKLDVHKKIEIYRDDFHRPELDTMGNDTRERNMLAQHMGAGGWHVQVDSDEYFPGFGAFARFLRRHSRWTAPGRPPIDVGAFWIPLFRKIDGGFLYVKDAYESFPLATNRPEYISARKSEHLIRYTRHCVFHQTWARPDEEVFAKISNWSHSGDFKTQSYFELWKSVDRHNYRNIHDFHPCYPKIWRSLGWTPGGDIPEFIANYRRHNPLTVPRRIYIRRRLGQIKKQWRSRLGKQQ